MQLENQDAVSFLKGVNSVRDGNIVSLSILIGETEWDYVVQLVFNVPNGTEGNVYTITLSGDVKFDYCFTNEHSPQQIAMVKCLWTDDAGFYLSLDPWKESEEFISEQDNDCFQALSVKLSVLRSTEPLWTS